MNKLIEEIKKRAKSDIKTIVLPESMDNRVLKAAEIISKEKLAKIILIGNESALKKKGFSLDLCEIIDPNTSTLLDVFKEQLYELRKDKGMTLEDAYYLIKSDYMCFSCMLVYNKLADGIVSGACHTTSETLKPALQLIKTKRNYKFVSSFFLMTVPECNYGEDGVFIFADSGLIQDPNEEELAEIAYYSAKSFEELVEKKAKVALLSHSTFGSSRHELVNKVEKATKILKEKYPEIDADGEMQVDAAIDKDVAKVKCKDSVVAGCANVLIFPNLDSGNISYKLVERLAKAKAYGPITQGMKAPVNDLSRGCSVEDIIGVVAITAIQAKK